MLSSFFNQVSLVILELKTTHLKKEKEKKRSD